jgi:hypothetical protein
LRLNGGLCHDLPVFNFYLSRVLLLSQSHDRLLYISPIVPVHHCPYDSHWSTPLSQYSIVPQLIVLVTYCPSDAIVFVTAIVLVTLLFSFTI